MSRPAGPRLDVRLAAASGVAGVPTDAQSLREKQVSSTYAPSNTLRSRLSVYDGSAPAVLSGSTPAARHNRKLAIRVFSGAVKCQEIAARLAA